MADQFTPIPTKGTKTNNNAAPDDGNVGVLPSIANAAPPSLTEGDQVLDSVDLAGGKRVNLMKLGTNAVSTNSGTADAGTLRVAPATNVVQQVSATTAANGVTNPLFTELTDGTNPLGTATNPLIVQDQGELPTEIKDSGLLTTAALAAGASTTLNVTLSANKAGNLLQVTAASSVRLKIQVQTVTSGGAPVTTTVRTFFTEAFQNLQHNPIADAITVAAAATQMGKFQVVITNEDNHLAADVYCSISWEED